MLSMVLKQMLRRPLPLLATLSFSIVLTAVLCGLHATNMAQRSNYETLYDTVPVTVTVTNIPGTVSDGLDANRWVYNVMSSSYELGQYITDLCVKMAYPIKHMSIDGQTGSCTELVGVSSLKADIALYEKGDAISQWKDCYDASVFASNEFVCVIPESMVADLSGEINTVTLEFVFTSYLGGTEPMHSYYDCSLMIVGTHSLSEDVIYCPFSVIKTVYSRLGSLWEIDSISGTMIDNHLIDEMWKVASDWFVKPDPLGRKIPWDYHLELYHPYALVVNDSQLTAAAEALENSITLNKICTLLTFVLSVAASFLIGFLMIRSRKREILLMRTMGTSNSNIYGSFTLEQMLCVILGALFGGAGFLWQPLERLGLFVGIYFVGLSLALLIFLRTNLLATMKQDE